MKKLLTVFAVMVLVSIIYPAHADKVLQCKDEEGNISYQEFCPPGTTAVGEKQYGRKNKTSAESETTNADISATMYVVPDCDTCDLVREFLEFRKISVTEKNVNDSLEVQNELKDKTGSEDLKVPVTFIGENSVTGYDRQQLQAALKSAGYTEPSQEEETGEENE